MSTITNAQKLHCVERELRMRHRVYDGLVARAKMSMAEADREIAIMTAIAADYRELVGREQLHLFDRPQRKRRPKAALAVMATGRDQDNLRIA